jgi:hypothetical protein
MGTADSALQEITVRLAEGSEDISFISHHFAPSLFNPVGAYQNMKSKAIWLSGLSGYLVGVVGWFVISCILLPDNFCTT